MRHRIINIHPDDDFYPAFNILVGCEGVFNVESPYTNDDGVETGFFWGDFTFDNPVSGASRYERFEGTNDLYFRGLDVIEI